MAIKSNGFSRNFSVCTVPSALQPTIGGLAFGRGNTIVRTGAKLSNSRKTFREHTPRLTPKSFVVGSAFLDIPHKFSDLVQHSKQPERYFVHKSVFQVVKCQVSVLYAYYLFVSFVFTANFY